MRTVPVWDVGAWRPFKRMLKQKLDFFSSLFLNGD